MVLYRIIGEGLTTRMDSGGFLIYTCFFLSDPRSLLASVEMQQFNRVRIFLDEDFTAVEKFTVSTRTCIRCNVYSCKSL